MVDWHLSTLIKIQSEIIFLQIATDIAQTLCLVVSIFLSLTFSLSLSLFSFLSCVVVASSSLTTTVAFTQCVSLFGHHHDQQAPQETALGPLSVGSS